MAFPANYEKPTVAKHEPGHLWPWVFQQDQVWVDAHGVEHEIAAMPLDYIENVVGFCDNIAWQIETLLEEELPEEERYAFDASFDLKQWVHALPLLIALKRKLALATISTALANERESLERSIEPQAEQHGDTQTATV